MESNSSARRRFLKSTFAIAGLAATERSATGQAPRATLAAPKDLHAYGERSRFEGAGRKGSLGLWPPAAGPIRDYGFRTPLQNSVGMLTPPSLHFVLSQL